MAEGNTRDTGPGRERRSLCDDCLSAIDTPADQSRALNRASSLLSARHFKQHDDRVRVRVDQPMVSHISEFVQVVPRHLEASNDLLGRAECAPPSRNSPSAPILVADVNMASGLGTRVH